MNVEKTNANFVLLQGEKKLWCTGATISSRGAAKVPSGKTIIQRNDKALCFLLSDSLLDSWLRFARTIYKTALKDKIHLEYGVPKHYFEMSFLSLPGSRIWIHLTNDILSMKECETVDFSYTLCERELSSCVLNDILTSRIIFTASFNLPCRLAHMAKRRRMKTSKLTSRPAIYKYKHESLESTVWCERRKYWWLKAERRDSYDEQDLKPNHSALATATFDNLPLSPSKRAWKSLEKECN